MPRNFNRIWKRLVTRNCRKHFPRRSPCHDRFGKVTFSRLFDPAIALAENGQPVDDGFVAMLEMKKAVLRRMSRCPPKIVPAWNVWFATDTMTTCPRTDIHGS